MTVDASCLRALPFAYCDMNFRPIGQCIYCGTREGPLSKEHISASALGGVATLPKASCRTCADVTSRFEGRVARDMFGELRIKQNYPSRRKELRPTELPAKFFNSDGEPRLAKLLVSDYPVLVPQVAFMEPPGILEGRIPTGGHPAIDLGSSVDPQDLARAHKALDAPTVALRMHLDWTAYCQTLAKTAHSLVCAVSGVKGWEPFLPPLLRLETNCFSHYIGSDPSPPDGVEGSAAAVSWATIGDDQAFIVHLRQLGRLSIPPCQVVVGLIHDQDAAFGDR
jgi:hypothetical protein